MGAGASVGRAGVVRGVLLLWHAARNPRLWEREERGGKMWDAGREKVP